MAERFFTEQWVPHPVELVFAFFANPANLPYMFPPRLQARVEDLRLAPPPPRPVAADPARRFKSVAAGEGSEILISFIPVIWVPRRVSWMARIVEFEWNSHFVDEQVRGPFAHFRHRHGIVAETREGQEGTLVTDAIEFELRYGGLGRLGAGLVLSRLKKSFAYRQKVLVEILATAARQAKKAGTEGTGTRD
jgi:ligand-binding SRPBCC domain-containing protein